jgi:hypothetical protein
VVLEMTRISDDEYAARLSAADFAIFPFRSITNSETVMTAVSCGVPVLIPGLEALSDLPAAAALKWEPGSGCAGIRAVLEEAVRTDVEKREAMRSAALAWAGERDWSAVAEATRIVYEQALAGGVR